MRRSSLVLMLILAAMLPAATGRAQARLPGTNAPSYAAAELDRIVSPIALYPDPLLAQVLAAATYPDDIPDAARWADGHHYLSGNRLTDAITADQLPWDPPFAVRRYAAQHPVEHHELRPGEDRQRHARRADDRRNGSRN